MGFTAISDSVVPDIFTAYLQAATEAKSRLVQSGAIVTNQVLNDLMAGGGLTFSIPYWNDLADTAANVSSDAASSPATVQNIDSHTQIGIRLSRNQVWGSADLVAALTGSDPMQAIAGRTAPYWTRQLQSATISTLKGVFADNDANDSGDYTHDISQDASTPGDYEEGVTDFNAEAFIDALATIGDSEEDLGIVIMHSKVYAKAKKNNLIQFVADSANPFAQQIPTFLGRQVLVDDSMPEDDGVYDTYILGAGALQLGVGQPKVPLALDREELQADGGGREFLITRVEWCIHPAGHAFVGSVSDGGPTNAQLESASNWDRRVSERKQVKAARLVTRES